ncbi:hypothetical protein [Streptomyces sp. NBC_01363]|uniref:hypothetical protein n=1 Tax=Streptomyces sp. NBC_01363 TaxID=2903840 RepID=UPI00225B25FD|nr:hypothetical protein [Streptomyces sp. NBC_01363]MCX4736223.1 hypothetical protein [Streptomyces sp. NBC_01363]
MARTPDLVLPLDHHDDVARRAKEAGELWPHLVAVPDRGRFLLAQLLWCPTAEHAQRLTELSTRAQRRQLALVGEIAEREPQRAV